MGNSVIYRPAYDAEVEYLESTGTQQIQLLSSAVLPFQVKVEYKAKGSTTINGNSRVLTYGSVESTSNFTAWEGVNRFFASMLGVEHPINSNQVTSIHTIVMERISATRGTFSINGQVTNITGNSIEIASNLKLFFLENFPEQAYKGKLYYMKLWTNNNLLFDLIPVRIGSVGYMYDKVTKQLFGNKGTGQFILGSDVSNAVIPQQRCVLYFGNQRSVGFERIYEEYEWLKGDKAAYINTGLFIDDFRSVYLYFKYKNFEQFDRQTYILGTGGVTNNYFNITTAWNYSGHVRISNVANMVNNLTSISGTHEIEIKNDKVYGDGVSYNNYNNRWAYVSHYYLQVFAMNGQNQSTGSISNLTITSDKWNINLVPCKLLTSIPAILDGNGKTRQAGECGMWDRVSNRFYGNVANSGTFTVEGAKCYEEYQWLVGGGGAYIDSNITSVNHIKFTVDTSGTTNAITIAYTHPSNEYAIQLEKNNIKAYFLGTSPNPLTFYVNGDRRQYTIDIDYVNGVLSVPETGQSGSKQFTTSFSYTHKFKLIKGFRLKDVFLDSMHLVPCKLTHGIPASMDANGIARPSGECGMWDKVNDKFYGNVNSSGSFTVSND